MCPIYWTKSTKALTKIRFRFQFTSLKTYSQNVWMSQCQPINQSNELKYMKLRLHRKYGKITISSFEIVANIFESPCAKLYILYSLCLSLSISLSALIMRFDIFDGRENHERYEYCRSKPVPVWMQIHFWCHFGFFNHSITSIRAEKRRIK